MKARTPMLIALLSLLAPLAGCDKATQTGAQAPAAEPGTPAAPAEPATPDSSVPPPAPVPAGWTVHEPAGQGFRVAMPGKPQSRKDDRQTENGTVTTTLWMTITQSGAAYSVGVTEMPAAVSEVLTPTSEFDDTRNKLLVKVEGKLVAEKNEEIDGHPVRSFSLFGKGPKGDTLYRLRLVRVGHRTYQLMSAHAKLEDLGADAKAFFASFVLTDK